MQLKQENNGLEPNLPGRSAYSLHVSYLRRSISLKSGKGRGEKETKLVF